MADYKVKYLLDPVHTNNLAKLLSYHALNEKVESSSLTNGENITTLEGSPLIVTKNTTGTFLNDVTCTHAAVTNADIEATNGIVHIVDGVFVPFGVFCPDTVFAAEQRSQARISGYGYMCRRKGIHHLTDQVATKPVGLTVSESADLVFWSNDYDYPHGSDTSWITSMGFTYNDSKKIQEQLIDPQGLDVDDVNKHIYYTQHFGNSISRMNFDGSDNKVVVQKYHNTSYQPSDVAVDPHSKKIFAMVEGQTDDYGYLAMYDWNGTNATVLKNDLVHPYGLCVDTINKHVFYVQGGHGGSVRCANYTENPCAAEIVADILEYPYMCTVDNAFAKYGGPTRIVYSEANRPGSIFYVDNNGKGKGKINILEEDELQAPMGIAMGCQAS